MAVRVEHGDMAEVLARMVAAGERVHAVVTDPPYHLTAGKRGGSGEASLNVNSPAGRARISTGFMGKAWDGGDIAFRAETWRLCFDLLPPGGHLLAFSGTRTFHRMACAIEDAGFEVRDAIMWHYGSGFPKSHNVGKKLDAAEQRCACNPAMRSVSPDMDSAQPLSGCAQSDVQQGVREHTDGSGERGAEGRAVDSVRDVRGDDPSATVATKAQPGGVLQRELPQQDVRRSTAADGIERPRQEQSEEGDSRAAQRGMEGRRDIPQEARELCVGQIREVSADAGVDGEGGRLCHGASACDGDVDREAADANGDSASHRPQAAEQSAEQSGIVAGQSQPQARGAWPLCGRCGKPIVPDGLGTALKPATEIICVARKPIEGTVAANVLAHGTGALNIDGCRVDSEGGRARYGEASQERRYTDRGSTNLAALPGPRGGDPAGRWPANAAHDGSEEVVRAFPKQVSGGTPPSRPRDKTRHTYGAFAGQENPNGIGSTAGSAARFFYSAALTVEDIAWMTEPANFAVECSNLQNEAAVSVLSNAVARSMPGSALIRASYRAPSTNATARDFAMLCDLVTATMQSLELRFSRGWPQQNTTVVASRAECVATLGPTGTMTITASHWKSDGSAAPVTFSITLPSAAHGAGDSRGDRLFYSAKADAADRLARDIEIVEVSWISEAGPCQAKLLVDTGQSPERAIVASGSATGKEWSTFLCGSGITDLCRRAKKSTIRTGTNWTTASGTWKPLLRSLTSASIVAAPSETANGGSHADSAASNILSATIIVGKTEFLPGASHALSETPLRISVGAKRQGTLHPTVKPVDLMRWLVRLVTPPGGTVLDPFAGSGTTGMACLAEGFDCIMVEREAEYVADIRRRIAHVGGSDTPLFAV